MSRSLDTGGGPPDDGAMEARFERLEQRMDALELHMDKLELRMDKLEQRMDKLEQRIDGMDRRLSLVEQGLAVIQANYATKEDLYRVINAQTWRLVTFMTGACTALVAATYYIARNVV